MPAQVAIPHGSPIALRNTAAAAIVLLRVLLALALVAAVTLVDFEILQINSATAGFTFLLVVLSAATVLGTRESIVASFASAAAYNFYFLPPVGKFSVADPQNWIALSAFLITAITASRLSAKGRAKAEEAEVRQRELQRMYDFSRRLILGEEGATLTRQIVRRLADCFDVQSAWLYDGQTGGTSRVEGDGNRIDPGCLTQTAESGQIWRSPDGLTIALPVCLGGKRLGSLAVAGGTALSEEGWQAVAQLVAIAMEQARVQQNAAEVEAERQNELLKSTLLDGLAHEFKTPLTSIRAATTTLISQTDLDRSAQGEMLSVIDEETARLSKLVTDSIELARLGSAPVTLSLEPYSLDRIVSEALEEIEIQMRGRPVVCDIAPNLPKVYVDRKLTVLALRLLLDNAVKYSPAHSEIHIIAAPCDADLAIDVRNFGRSIAAIDRERIFQKFYRGLEVRTRIPGTGMGLYIGRQIVRAQGGDLILRNSEGGATFSLIFRDERGQSEQDERIHSL